MGNVYATYIKSPDTMPDFRGEATFDPLYGFPRGRQERQMIATEAEMEDASLQAVDRDYCAHHLIDFLKCRKQKFPWVVSCKHERHVYEQCQYEDYVLRMKEYEREKRLLERRKRKGETGGNGETMSE